MPHLCLSCHGGYYDVANDVVTGANFLPFDGESFGFSSQPNFTRPQQEEELRQLNEMVLHTTPAAPIALLIQGWYTDTGGVSAPGAVQKDAFVPPAFNTNATDQALYNDVVKHYCRGCHIAQGFDLGDPLLVGVARAYVFGSFDMPHAEVTSHKFWTSRAPSILARNRGWSLNVTRLDDEPPGDCFADDCTLRAAIIAANADPDLSIITFAVSGSVTLNQGSGDDFGEAGDLDITADLILLGNGAGVTIVDGDAQDRVFSILGGASVIMQGLTVRGGASPDAGGGILVDEASLTLNMSVLRSNVGVDGAGLAVLNGSTAHINQSTLGPGNDATAQGGGVYVDSGTLEIRNSTLSGNTAIAGAGLYATGSNVTLVHTTVTDNDGEDGAGGLVLAELSNLNMGNSLVAGNISSRGREPDCGMAGRGSYNSLGYNLVGEFGDDGGCPVEGGGAVLPGAIAAAISPALTGDPATGVLLHLPVPGGAAIDAIPLGLECAPPSYDARNMARPRDGDGNGSARCDIGAVEFMPQLLYLPIVRR